jgi:maleate isomerase
VAYGRTTGGLVHGPGYDRRIEDRVGEAADAPVVATAASAVRAPERLDAERVVVTTPYVDDGGTGLDRVAEPRRDAT